MSNIFALAAAAAAALGAASAGSTAAAPDAPTVRVRYADLNLGDPRDARVMISRLRKAAVQVCRKSPWNVGSDFDAIERFDRCYRQAFGQAVTALGRPQVTAAAGLVIAPSRRAEASLR